MSEIRPDAFDDEKPMPPRVRLPPTASRWNMQPLPARDRALVDAKFEDYLEMNQREGAVDG